MFITQCDLPNLIKWFRGSSYEVMAIYLSGGTPSDNVILSNIIDNWREIDNLSRNMVCYIYFDPNDIQTEDMSVMNFVSWVREYNCVENRNYRKDADASIRITREICNSYNIFEYELPGLLFIDKKTNSHQLVPIEHFNEIKQYLSIINIVCSFTQDVSMAESGIESVRYRIDKDEKDLVLQKSTKEFDIQQLEIQRDRIEMSLSQLQNIDSTEIENDFERIWNSLSSFSEIAYSSGLPSNIDNIQNIKKFLRKNDIVPSKEYDDILLLTHKCVCSLAAKYHIDKGIIIDSAKKGLSTWTSVIVSSINDNIERLSLKKKTLDEKTCDNCDSLKSLKEKESELIQNNIHIMETAQKEYNVRLLRIIDVYSKKLSEVLNWDRDVCKELIQGLNTQHLFGFIKAICEKQITIDEEQDVKISLIRSAISNKRYDVFISCKSEDYILANDVYDFLVSIGKHPFLANKSIDDIHYDEYNILIRETIDFCPDMIVVLSNPNYANTPYVSFEWNLFVNEKAAGRKPGNLIPIIGNLSDIPLLPIALRQCQACTLINYKEFIPRYLS